MSGSTAAISAHDKARIFKREGDWWISVPTHTGRYAIYCESFQAALDAFDRALKTGHINRWFQA